MTNNWWTVLPLAVAAGAGWWGWRLVEQPVQMLAPIAVTALALAAALWLARQSAWRRWRTTLDALLARAEKAR